MADTKVSDFTSLTGASVDGANDVVPIVDDSESGAARNKKITVDELKSKVTEDATLDADTDVSGNGWVLDEDDMVSDDDTKVPTQQSVKAYVDNELAAVGGTDENVKISTNDTTAGKLISKVTSTGGTITLTEVNDGGNETLNFEASAGSIDHDSLLNFVADEHVDHSSININTLSGSGLSGGGDLTSSRTLSLNVTGLLTAVGADQVTDEIAIYNQNDGATRKITVAELITLIEPTFDLSNADNSTSAFIASAETDLSGASLTSATVAGTDKVLIQDADDSDNLKTVTAQSIADLALGGTDENVKISANDTTAGYLEDKIVSADSKLTISTLNDGGDEDLQIAVNEGNIDHDALTNFVANEHIDWTTDAGVDVADENIAASSVTQHVGSIDHDSLLNFVANEHIDHTTVDITAGVGLSGGGDISATRTLDLDINGLSAPTGADASTDELAVYNQADAGVRKITIAELEAVIDPMKTDTVVYKTQYVDAGAMKPAITNGAATADVETTTNAVNYYGWDFDAAADEAVWFKFKLPEAWDGTNIKVKFDWTDGATAGSGDVVWTIAALPVGNDDAIDAATLAAASVTDTFIASGDLHTTSATADLTMTGHASGDLVFFKVSRDADNGSDTYDQDARLLGIVMQIGESNDGAEW